MTDNKLADAIAARDAAIQQAQIWKMEAQTANATIAEIYRLVGSKAGNWNGAKPVREALAAPDVRDAQPPANGDAHSVVDALPPLPPVDGYDKRVAGHYSAASMHAYARTVIAALQQKVTTPALPEVTDEDEAEAWDVLLICDGDMRKVLESYRARLMAKAVQS